MGHPVHGLNPPQMNFVLFKTHRKIEPNSIQIPKFCISSFAPDYSIQTVSEFHAEVLWAIASEGRAQGPYVVAGVGFEPADARRRTYH